LTPLIADELVLIILQLSLAERRNYSGTDLIKERLIMREEGPAPPDHYETP